MNATPSLPSALSAKLAGLARHVRRTRLLRGLSLLALLLVLTGAAALAADAGFGLPTAVRVGLLAVWSVLGIGVAFGFLLLPLVRRIDAPALAAVIEEKYPELGERLTSAVELAAITDNCHGSPDLIALLMSETESRTRPLDFRRALSPRAVRRLAGAAAAVLVLALVPAVVWPGRCLELGERFLLPWRSPGAAVPYALEVTPGDAFAARGRPLTISVRVQPLADPAVLPRECSLVVTDAAGKTTKLRMPADRADAFSLKLDRVAGSFRYRAEAGKARSEEFQLTAVEPVELAADSPTVTVTPPEYARATIETQTVHGLADLTALQYGKVSFAFRFTQPASAGELEWRSPAAPATAAPSAVYPLALSGDGREATLELPAVADGAFRLVLEGEHGIRTELGPRALSVKKDLPPAFIRVSASDGMKAVLAYDIVPVEMTLADDVGVDRVDLEYRVKDGPAQSEAVPLEGRGTPDASARYAFKLAGKVKEGDLLLYRLKARDNRRVPEAGLGPNVTYHPSATRWLTLQIARKADPLRQQEILAQRDAINRRLDDIKRALLAEQRGVYKVRMESRGEESLSPEHAQALDRLRRENRETENALRELAEEAGQVPPLQEMADRAMEVADQEMHRTAQELRDAEKPNEAAPRDRRLRNADKELASALKKLDELRKDNEQTAQARLDQMKLEMAAQRQEDLARRAAEQAARDPVKDPTVKGEVKQLEREQNDLAGELQRLAEQSDNLRDAVDAARAEQARHMAEQARELAQAQRDLAEASRQTDRQRTRDRLAELAKKQKQLAEQAARLSRETRRPAEAANLKPLKPEDAQKAADSLERGDPREAVNRQAQSARALERHAEDLAKASPPTKVVAAKPNELTPRQAAQELAKRQRGLAQTTAKTQKLPAEKGKQALEMIGQVQKDLRDQAARLPGNPPREATEPARSAMKEAQQALAKGEAEKAQRKQNEAAEALERLARKLPDQPQMPADAAQPNRPTKQQAEQAKGLAQKQWELREEVRRALEELNQTNPAARENPAADLARRQEQIAQKAGELAKQVGQEQGQKAAPSQQARQAAQSARQASNRMQAGALPQAREAGQQTAQQLRQLARQMAETPRGNAQPDKPDPVRQARDLARQQEEVNRDLEPVAPNADAQRAQQLARQQDLQRQTGDLNQQMARQAQQMRRSPQAQQAMRQAAQSGQQAQQSMQQAQAQGRQGNSGQAQQSQQQAAQSLDRAAEQAGQAARQMAAQMAAQGQPGDLPTGRAVQQAQNQMGQAQNRLSQGQTQAAQNAMQQAAQSLQDAAQQMAQNQPGQPNQSRTTGERGAAGGGKPNPALLGMEGKQFAGKAWGELPGELRTKILQDMKDRYGEDYARRIKLYFEQMAERK